MPDHSDQHRSRRPLAQRRLMGLLSGALAVGATLTLAVSWQVSRHAGTSTALAWLAAGVTVLLGVSWLLIRELDRQRHEHRRMQQALHDSRQRLLAQQQAWHELRDLQHEARDSDFYTSVLASTARLMNVPRVSIWLLDDDTMTCQASLDAAQVGEQLPIADLDGYLGALRESPSLASGEAQQDPRLACLNDYLLKHEVVSMLDAGVFVGGELRGILCCESLTPRRWQAEEVSCLLAVSGLISQFAESLRRRAAEQDLHRYLHNDDVTGLPTLRGLDAPLERHLDTGRFYLGVLRIGGLSQINETLGQRGGDEALSLIAQHLQRYMSEALPGIDLARLPSNRLVLVIPDTSRDVVHQLLAELLETLNAHPWWVANQAFQLQFALGIASYPDHSDSVEQLLQRAELALKEARHDTRHFVAFYASELSEWQQQQNLLERELREAIRSQQFCVYLQPQFDHHGTLSGAEVLLRWQHPERGLLVPGGFIHEAERSGLIRPIGNWVLEQAGQLLAGPLANTPLSLSVNVSVQQLRDEDFVPRIARLMHRHAIAPGRLTLEVVESLLLAPGINLQLKALRDLGVELSLDDFGTGYSSLRYLHDFRVDEVKLDKVFIDVLQHCDDAPLARSIIALAKTLGLKLVAEGVETPFQLDYLSRHGVDLIQGYHLARPEPVADFVARLECSPSLVDHG
ncbi:diguanylate cyclase (GGDEF) domain-containing protein [Franzmannia pantelleriensis]|uniref:Diguanylate cyclase (GGDEF) domain-containing protein n=1 Tax=Franzmannia pantelleriensis TaxID=48727 RepID=A0A1G9UFF2_9GAMM|nr:GGDEF and EAL domain-containing protein [Halomonas pantelleriensis]SDM58652.1 diguanylate cyclase (GGDEF) domain-containing protein [Halomonas pantelleriensis]